MSDGKKRRIKRLSEVSRFAAERLAAAKASANEHRKIEAALAQADAAIKASRPPLPVLSTQTSRLHCRDCEAIWNEQTLCNVPFKVLTAHIESIHCPECGASYKKLAFVTNEDALRESLRAKHAIR